MITPSAVVWAMSALSIMMVVIAVYFAIFFMILYVIAWGIIYVLRNIAKILYHAPY